MTTAQDALILPNGATATLSRSTTSVSFNGDSVPINEARLAPPVDIIKQEEPEVALASTDSVWYQVLGGGENYCLVNRILTGSSSLRLCPVSEGTVTDPGSDLFSTFTAPVTGTSGTPDLYDVGISKYDGTPSGGTRQGILSIGAYSEFAGIILITCEVVEYDVGGSGEWNVAGFAGLYSTDGGVTWQEAFDGRDVSAADTVWFGASNAKRRVREWSSNNKPTTLYSRENFDDALVFAHTSVDYISRAGNSSTGATVTTIWTRFTHLETPELKATIKLDITNSPGFPAGGSIDHAHHDRCLEILRTSDSVRGLQKIGAVGDGSSKSVIYRYSFFPTTALDVGNPLTYTNASFIAEVEDSSNWTFEFLHGSIEGTTSYGIETSQFINSMMGKNFGEMLVTTDLDNYVVANIDAYSQGDPIVSHRGPDILEGIALFAAEDGQGRACVYIRDNDENNDVNASNDGPEYGSGRLIYTSNWFESWGVAQLVNAENANRTGNQVVPFFSEGRLYWSEGANDILTKTPVILHRDFHPVNVDPDPAKGNSLTANLFGVHVSGGGVDWRSQTDGGNSRQVIGNNPQIIQAVNGVFTVNGYDLPKGPFLSDYAAVVEITDAEADADTGEVIVTIAFGINPSSNSIYSGDDLSSDYNGCIRFYVANVSSDRGSDAFANRAIQLAVNPTPSSRDGLRSPTGNTARSGVTNFVRGHWRPFFVHESLPALNNNGRAAVQLRRVNFSGRPGGMTLVVVPDFYIPTMSENRDDIGQPIPLAGVSVPETLRVTNLDIGGSNDWGAANLGIPYNSWDQWSQAGTPSLKYLVSFVGATPADDHVSLTWDRANNRLQLDVSANGVAQTTENIDFGGEVMAIRHSSIKLQPNIVGSNLVVDVWVDSKKQTVTYTGLATSLATLDEVRFGEDPNGNGSPIDAYGVEVSSDVPNPTPSNSRRNYSKFQLVNPLYGVK